MWHTVWCLSLGLCHLSQSLSHIYDYGSLFMDWILLGHSMSVLDIFCPQTGFQNVASEMALSPNKIEAKRVRANQRADSEHQVENLSKILRLKLPFFIFLITYCCISGMSNSWNSKYFVGITDIAIFIFVVALHYSEIIQSWPLILGAYKLHLRDI